MYLLRSVQDFQGNCEILLLFSFCTVKREEWEMGNVLRVFLVVKISVVFSLKVKILVLDLIMFM